MNYVVHFEIQVDDLDRAQKFYESVFDWTFKEMGGDMGDYRLIMTGDNTQGGPATHGINGGLLKRNAPAPGEGVSPNGFVCTVNVDDIDVSMDKAEAAGGKPQTEKMNVPSIGQLRYYKDTEGNIFGMLQPSM